jgi:hypothetical protein
MGFIADATVNPGVELPDCVSVHWNPHIEGESTLNLRIKLLIGVCMGLALVWSLSACASDAISPLGAGIPSLVSPEPAVTIPTHDTPRSPAENAYTEVLKLSESFADLMGNGYRIGVAAAAPGERVSFEAGDWPGGEAWSTIKVPLAVAAVRAGSGVSVGNGYDVFPYGSCALASSLDMAIKQAITVSDNCAA